MDLTAFGDAPTLPSWVRLTLAAVAILHALLCARVVVQRLIRRFVHREREIANPERVPTAAMVAYGILTAHIAQWLLVRLPQGPPLIWDSVFAYGAALAFGTAAFAQIVVLTRRSSRPGPARRDGDRR